MSFSYPQCAQRNVWPFTFTEYTGCHSMPNARFHASASRPPIASLRAAATFSGSLAAAPRRGHFHARRSWLPYTKIGSTRASSKPLQSGNTSRQTCPTRSSSDIFPVSAMSPAITTASTRRSRKYSSAARNVPVEPAT